MEPNQLQSQQYSPQYIEEIDLQKYWLVLKRRWLPAAGVLSTVVAMSTLYALTQSPSYEAKGKLLIQTDRSSALTGLNPGSDLGQVTTLYSQNNPLDTQAEILKSIPVVEEAIEALDLRDDEGERVKPLDAIERLGVKSVPGTDVLQVSYESADPELSAAVVNAVMESYTRKNIADNRAETIAAREFIQQQLPIAEDAVNDAEIALRDFKEANQIVALDQEAASTVTTISGLENQIAQTQADLVSATAQSLELRRQVGMNPEQAVNLSRLNQAPGVQESLTNLQDIQSQLSVARTQYRDNHPTVTSLVRQESSLLALLQQRVAEVLGDGSAVSVGDLQLGTLRQDLTADLVQAEVTRLGLEQRLASLTGTRNAFQQQANTFPSLEKTQRDLERQLQAAQTTYEALLTRLQEIRVAENQNIGNAQIIETADAPEESVGTSAKLILAAGVVAGSLLAIATAFLLDLMDGSIKTVKEAQELLGYKVLGVIPKFSRQSGTPPSDVTPLWTANRIIVHEAPQSPVSKAYQMVQANLQCLCAEHGLKTLAVSSSVAGEGKSEVCANLAMTMAQVGQQVLLVDANMNDPVQHHLWNLNNTVGLSNIIINQADAATAVQAVSPNLSVLPAGMIPPNPLSLINSQAMRQLLDRWSKDYDVVLLDTPALSGNADAATLAKGVDGCVLVARPGTVTGESAKASREFLERFHVNVLGMVVNGVNIRNEPDSYFYYVDDKQHRSHRLNHSL